MRSVKNAVFGHDGHKKMNSTSARQEPYSFLIEDFLWRKSSRIINQIKKCWGYLFLKSRRIFTTLCGLVSKRQIIRIVGNSGNTTKFLWPDYD